MRAATTSCWYDAYPALSDDDGFNVFLRSLGEQGRLWQAARDAPETVAASLRAAAFRLALPLVWERHSRPLEIRKGHRRCACGISQLAPECLDGFTDDLEAVVSGLLAYRFPIANMEGWLVARMAYAIKDGNRVRRAREMGAQQRVRVPAQIATALGGSLWLVTLAGRVLQWVGVRQAAGTSLWPIGAWAEERAKITGDWASERAHGHIVADVETVLRIMREADAAWYAKYVERPLGNKWAPVALDGPAIAGSGAAIAGTEPQWLELVPQHERGDARLTELAAVSLAMIEVGIAAGQDPETVVAEVLEWAFLGDVSVCGEMDELSPTHHCDASVVLPALLADPVALRRLAATVIEIVGASRRPRGSSHQPCTAGVAV